MFIVFLFSPGQLNPCDGPCTDYGIVMTARYDQIDMKIYKVTRRKGNPIALPSDIKQIKTSPEKLPLDIVKIAASPEKFDSVFATLVKAAKKVIPKNYYFGTPLFFMSSFSTEDIYSFAFTNVLVRVLSYLNNVNKHPFLPPSKDSVKKLAGDTEITYRWLAAAFLADYFTPQKEGRARDLGLVNFNLNMIYQNSFPVYYITKNATHSISVGEDTYLLATTSHTQNGLSSALRKYFQSLTDGKKPVEIPNPTRDPTIGIPPNMDIEENLRKNVPHPQNGVWPPSNVGNIQNGQNPNMPSMETSKSIKAIPSPCSPPGVQLEIKDDGRQYVLAGSGDVDKCRNIIQNVILNDFDRPRNSPYMISPRRSVQFYAYSEVVSVLETIGCTSCSQYFTAEKIDAAARKYCKGESKQSSPANTANCLNANFYYVMMTKAHRFNPKKPIKILKSSRHNIDEDWALGAFLYKMKLLYYNVA